MRQKHAPADHHATTCDTPTEPGSREGAADRTADRTTGLATGETKSLRSSPVEATPVPAVDLLGLFAEDDKDNADDSENKAGQAGVSEAIVDYTSANRTDNFLPSEKGEISDPNPILQFQEIVGPPLILVIISS